jgi:hypothetical protein
MEPVRMCRIHSVGKTLRALKFKAGGRQACKAVKQFEVLLTV